MSYTQEQMQAVIDAITAKTATRFEGLRADVDEQKKQLDAIERAVALKGAPGVDGPSRKDSGGFKDVGEIMAALYRKSKGEGFDKRLDALQVKAAGVSEGIPSEGGFAIPTLFVDRALGEDLLDTVLLQLCDRQTMTTDKMTAPAFVDTSHATTAPFGISWSIVPEGGSFGTIQGTPFRALELNARKAGALFLVSNEWLMDSSSGIRGRLENIWRASLRWYVEDLLWAGIGGGEPLGALNGAGALEIPKEVGQKADTIEIENIVDM